MMRWIVLIALLTLALPARADDSDNAATIAATVNGDAITMADVTAREQLVMASSNMPDSAPMRDKLKPQVVNMLIEEDLIKQETTKLKLTVSDDEIEKGFAELAGQNKMTAEQFRDTLRQSGVSEAAVKQQIRAQLSWVQIIKAKIRPQIEITDQQIDAEMQKSKDAIGKPEYLLAEIYLPVDSPSQDGDVRQLADKLVSELQAHKGPFSAAAAQFSQSASASKGGDIGWMQEDQLSPEVGQEVAQMNPGDLAGPVHSLAGYYILLLREKREITASTLPSRDDIRQKIGMTTLDRLQRRYMLDLKSAAYVDRRAS